MSQLNNLFISSSYQGLLKLTDSTQGLTNTLQTVQTGDGMDSPLEISMTDVNISGSFYINGVPITNGTSGTSGTSGSSGASGSSGESGSSGTSGTSGSSGSSGSDGSSGTSGASGSSGSAGSDGSSGTSGSNGTDGSSGTSGDSLFALTGSVWNTTNDLGITGSLHQSGTFYPDQIDWINSSIVQGTGSYVLTTNTSGVTQYDTYANIATALSPFINSNRDGLITTGSISTTQSITGSLIVSGALINTGSLTEVGNVYMLSPAFNNGSVKLNITGSDNFVTSSNLIFGNNTGAAAAQQTGSIVITGSNNILLNAVRFNTLVTAGTYGYIGGNTNIFNTIPTLNTGSLLRPTISNNIYLSAQPISLNFITSSLAAPIFSGNIGVAGVTLNHQSGSVSAQQNLGFGTLTSNANTTPLDLVSAISTNIFAGGQTTLNHNSSSITYTNNIGNVTVTNNYTSSVLLSANNMNVTNNIFQGFGNSVVVSGSNSSAPRRSMTYNLVVGENNIINSNHSGSAGGGHLIASAILGESLIMSASHTSNTVGGTVIVGRFNATGSLQESSQDTVFVVGTGTAANARRNALHIDYQNNTRITGSVSISGSLTVNGVAVAGSDRNGLITTGSAGGSQSITGSLNMTNGNITISGAANGLTILGNAGGLSIASGTFNLNNDGQSSIANQQTGRNVLYVDNTYSNFFFGNVPKATSGRFSGDTGNFIVSPTYAAFETGSNNIMIGTANVGLVSGSRNIIIGGQPNFGSSNYENSLYIANGDKVYLQRNGIGAPLQIGLDTQITGSLNVSNNASITGSLTVSGSNTIIGNTVITGSLYVSSSVQKDVIVEGQLWVSSSIASATGTTIQPQINVVGYFNATGQQKSGSVQISPGKISLTRDSVSGDGTLSIDGFNGTTFSTRGVDRSILYGQGSGSIRTELGVQDDVFTYYNYQKFEVLSTGSLWSDYNYDLDVYDGYMRMDANIGLNNPPLQMLRGLVITGSLTVTGGINYSSGSNQTVGTALLDGGNPGTVTVSNSLVTSNSLIFLTKQTLTNAHMVAVSSKGSGTFTITSNGNGDADTVAYQIINPA